MTLLKISTSSLVVLLTLSSCKQESAQTSKEKTDENLVSKKTAIEASKLSYNDAQKELGFKLPTKRELKAIFSDTNQSTEINDLIHVDTYGTKDNLYSSWNANRLSFSFMNYIGPETRVRFHLKWNDTTNKWQSKGVSVKYIGKKEIKDKPLTVNASKFISEKGSMNLSKAEPHTVTFKNAYKKTPQVILEDGESYYKAQFKIIKTTKDCCTFEIKEIKKDTSFADYPETKSGCIVKWYVEGIRE